jgi:hypothetical protein
MPLVHRIIQQLRSFFDVGGLDTTAYVALVEREFEIVIRDDAAGPLATLGDLCGYVWRQCHEQGRPLREDEVWQSIRRLTSKEFGVKADELHPGLRFVEDLNC